MSVLRKYGVLTYIDFPLVVYKDGDFVTGASFATGDSQVIKDYGAAANTTELPSHVANGIYKLALSATEMQAANVIVTVKDQTASKVWEDQAVVVDTYGNASAEHAFDFDTATQDVNVAQVSDSASTADRLEAWFNGFITGTVEGTPSSSVFDTDLAEATNDHFNHMIVAFTGGALLGQSRRVSDYAGLAGTLTVQPAFTEAPGVGDTFIISPVIVGGLDANGRMDVGAVGGTAQTAGDIIGDLAIVDGNVDSILVDTAEIGAAGAGLTEAGGTGDHLTAIPWNASWDAEVQSEVDDGLVARGLDHLVNVAVAGADVTDNSIFAYLVSSSATADWDDFVNTTDSLQAIQDDVEIVKADHPNRATKNVALSNVVFLMVDSTDHVTPQTGLTVTGQISQDGAALATLTNSVSEISNGLYSVNLTQAEMNADTVVLRFSATGADDRILLILTQPT